MPLHNRPPKSKPYHIIQQKFSQKELDFWFQSGITPEILKQYKVILLKEFRSENRESRPFGYTSSDSEPIFGYMGKRYIKIYRPFSEVRFLYGGMIGEGYCFGLEQLPSKGDTLFIMLPARVRRSSRRSPAPGRSTTCPAAPRRPPL